MKTINYYLTFVLIVICPFSLHAQIAKKIDFCRTGGNFSDLLTTKNPLLTTPQTLLAPIQNSYGIRVFIHVINRTNGTGGQTPQEVATAFCTLQTDYAPYNIGFVLLGTDQINNDIYYNKVGFVLDANNDGKFDDFSPNSHSNAIDIYLFPNDKLNFGLAAGIPGTALVLGGNGYGINLASSHVLSHEIGHCIGLFHTFHGSSYEPTTGSCAELVNGSNCATCGDLVCDTPADPWTVYTCITQATCTWTGYGIPSCCGGSAKDANNDYYNPNPNLIMAYTTPNCMTFHTNGQRLRMLRIIAISSFLQGAALHITGPTLLCNTGSYTLDNVQPGSTIVWHSNVATVVSQLNPNQCTFQKSSNGNGTIDATVTSGCGSFTISLSIHAGAYSSSDYPITGLSSAPCKSIVYYTIPILEGATLINWTWPTGWTYIGGQNTNYLTIRTGTSSGGVSVGVDNTCGQSGSHTFKYTSVYCNYLSLSVSPNPSSEYVNIVIPETNTLQNDTIGNSTSLTSHTEFSKPSVYNVMILDNNGIIYMNITKKSMSFALPIQNLRTGNYTIKVFDGKNTFTSPLIVIH
jgi:hypothetical protein